MGKIKQHLFSSGITDKKKTKNSREDTFWHYTNYKLMTKLFINVVDRVAARLYDKGDNKKCYFYLYQ